MQTARFRKLIWNHYRKYGRHDLLWRHTKDPYRIFVSEVMLQQTQVSRVLKKYSGFLKAFPNWQSLANAPIPNLLRVWQGMGYNRRALQLKRAVQIVVKEYSEKLPKDIEKIDALPGIGKATAASIAAFAFNASTVFIETNIRRVFIHHFFPQAEKQHSHILKNVRMSELVSDKAILSLVKRSLDKNNPSEWYWALMDYGSALAKSVPNPNRRSAHYAKQSVFKCSKREARGRILTELLNEKAASIADLIDVLDRTKEETSAILSALKKEGFVVQRRGRFILA